MFEHSRTKSKLVVNAILLLVGVVLYAGLWYGTVYISNITAVEQARIIEAQTVLQRESKTEKALLDTKDIRTQIAGFIVANDEVVGFIESLEELARRVGVEETTEAVSDVNFPGLDASKWGGLQIVLSTQGSWAQVYQFLSLVEHLPYRANVVRAVVEKGESDTKEEVVDFWKGDLTLQVLKRK